MKLPKQNGYYRFYDAYNDAEIIVVFKDGIILMFGDSRRFDPHILSGHGSYFLEPIEPIKF